MEVVGLPGKSNNGRNGGSERVKVLLQRFTTPPILKRQGRRPGFSLRILDRKEIGHVFCIWPNRNDAL
jgi:hypothetical protein